MKITYKRLALAALLSSLVFTLVACVGIAPKSPEQVVYPTVIIQQVVTQVVATVTPAAPAAQPANSASAPAPEDASSQQPGMQRLSLDGFDPLSVAIYYPLKGCVASRLHVKDQAFVAHGGDQLGLLHSPDVRSAPMWRRMHTGEVVDIVDGPYCDAGMIVWRVNTSDGYSGYVVEGDGNTYWLWPQGTKLAKVPKPEIQSYQPSSSLNSFSRLGLPAQCQPR
jgi:hypothetical protein